MPKKTFTAGEVLAAADVNTFLMDQSVMTFADSAARGSAIGTATEGMVTYLEDTDGLELWNGTAWVSATPASGGGSGNAVINGGMEIWQRGTTFNSIANFGFCADRFFIGYDGAPTVNVTRETFTPGAAPESGYEYPFFLRVSQTAVGGSTVVDVRTRLEDVRLFAGQTATLSFWAKADSARTLNLSTILQDFGSGGSAGVTVTADTTSFSLTTSFQRFTTTISFPSISGKTIGTGSAISIFFRNAAASGLVFDLWGVQLEAGSTATPFRRNANNLQGELAACQRYFEVVENFRATGSAQTSGSAIFTYFMKVTKRASVTLTFESTTYAFDVTAIASKTGTSQTTSTLTESAAIFIINGSSGMTVGQHLQWNGGRVLLSAEL